jgi:uracil-DNA glycosylase
MKVNKAIGCLKFPCTDVNHTAYVIPQIELQPEKVTLVMISEAAPADPTDYYYAGDHSLFHQTTVQAFNDAGVKAGSIADILDLGVYLTTAVKCGKTTYGIQTDTVKECSRILERELALFSNVKVYLLMGDVAIQALNAIARRAGEGRVIPASSTYKIRGGQFFYRGIRAFPSYLQAGPSFYIEKSKRKMIAEDIAAAIRLVD